MAFLNENDLIDSVRHEFDVDDSTGLCSKIIARPSRRTKPGGLPLGFRQRDSDDSDDDQYSPRYQAYFDELSTRGIINSRLRSITVDSASTEMAKLGASCTNVIVAGKFPGRTAKVQTTGTNSELVIFKQPTSHINSVSLTSKLLEKAPPAASSSLAHFAVFESADVSTGREVLVFYPFAGNRTNKRQAQYSLKLRVQPRVHISELVGVCCYVYMRHNRTPDIRDPSQYRLLMAEENGEVDCDLPPIDGHRLLCELGSCWSTVALVHRSEISSAADTKVTVYTVSGGCYEFELDSLDVSLEWLRDQALDRRIQEEGESFMCSSSYPDLREYLLETLTERDKPLNLEMTIASTACKHFLMLRKNSSRGDFQVPVQRPALTIASPGIVAHSRTVTVGSTTSGSTEMAVRSSTSRDACSLSPTPLSGATIELGDLINEYHCVRLHRYKPKWTALLALHRMGFELSPCQLERRRGVGIMKNRKYIRVSWDHVGGVEIVDHTSTKRVLRLTWLRMPENLSDRSHRMSSLSVSTMRCGSVSSGNGSLGSYRSECCSPQETAQVLGGSHWKVIQLEAAVDDAWAIAQKINEILESSSSQVRSVYAHSSGGKVKPSRAAGAMDNSDHFATLPKSRRAPRKISRIASTFANAMPSLPKRLSRQTE